MCKFWNHLKIELTTNSILYVTRNNLKYKLVKFSINRSKEEVLQYSIPKRNGEGVNIKSVPYYVICAAFVDLKKGISINKQWIKINYLEIDNAGGCNIKVIQAIVKKYSYLDN